MLEIIKKNKRKLHLKLKITINIIGSNKKTENKSSKACPREEFYWYYC